MPIYPSARGLYLRVASGSFSAWSRAIFGMALDGFGKVAVMSPEQLASMRDRMHEMVDELFNAEQGIMREAMVEGWGWPLIRITFAHQDDPKLGYTLVVGVESPDADS